MAISLSVAVSPQWAKTGTTIPGEKDEEGGVGGSLPVSRTMTARMTKYIRWQHRVGWRCLASTNTSKRAKLASRSFFECRRGRRGSGVVWSGNRAMSVELATTSLYNVLITWYSVIFLFLSLSLSKYQDTD